MLWGQKVLQEFQNSVNNTWRMSSAGGSSRGGDLGGAGNVTAVLGMNEYALLSPSEPYGD